MSGRKPGFFGKNFTVILLAMAVTGGILEMAVLFLSASESATVLVPASDIPAYHAVNWNDFANKTISKSALKNDSILASDSPSMAAYTTKKLYAGEQVSNASIRRMPGNASIPSDWVVYGLTVPGTAVNGSGIEAGDHVDLIFVPFNETTKANQTYALFVMDIKPVKEGDLSSDHVLVAAISEKDAYMLINQSVSTRYVIVKK